MHSWWTDVDRSPFLPSLSLTLVLASGRRGVNVFLLHLARTTHSLKQRCSSPPEQQCVCVCVCVSKFLYMWTLTEAIKQETK